MKKHLFQAAAAAALTLSLCGCAAGLWPPGLGAEDPDLVVYNDSAALLGSIALSSETESQAVSMADGCLLERGESYGFEVDHPGRVTVELWDPEGRPVGRCQVELGEERVYLTVGEEGRLFCGTAEPWSARR